MKIFANAVNGKYLREILPGPEVDVDWVKAAIAYGSDAESLVKHCLDHRHRLDIWMRYDHTVPVSPPLLRKLLSSTRRNLFCYLVPNAYHAKVIWWKGYGVYIGSANLTDRAWVSNIEVGVFLSEDELESSSSLQEIEGIFEFLESLEQAFPLTEEVVQEQEQLDRERHKVLDALETRHQQKLSHPHWDGPTFVQGRVAAVDKRRQSFLQDWDNGLTHLRDIADVCEKYRPKWMPAGTPTTWQADQFLHAYYYNEVVEGKSHPYEEFYSRNRGNPASARDAALQWWAGLPSAPSGEDANLTERAPVIRKALQQDHIRKMSLQEFERVLDANHSSRNHASKVAANTVAPGSPGPVGMEQRISYLANSFWDFRNGRGQGIGELLYYVLYAGPWQDTPLRLFDAVNNPERCFPRLGVNQLAEMVGWARPEHFPPRNGRTSKALKALGYDVRIY